MVNRVTMKHVQFLLSGIFLMLLFSGNALSQEKAAEETPDKPKDNTQSKPKDPKEIHGFKVQVFPDRRRQPGRPAPPNQPPVIADLKLDKTELTISDSIETEMPLLIRILTESSDPEGDVLVYNYEISCGKIIGKGAKVVWDLTEATAGEYTIKVSADDGCGVCGNSVTKTVTVK